MTVTHINPPELPHSPVFSQAVASSRAGLLFVGGQNGVGADGVLLDGFAAQTEQAFRNLVTVLAAAGCTPRDVVKLNIVIVGDEDVRTGLGAAQAVWGGAPTAVSVLRVAGLAVSGALIEVDAIAELPE